jgi:hypothetical protein
MPHYAGYRVLLIIIIIIRLPSQSSWNTAQDIWFSLFENSPLIVGGGDNNGRAFLSLFKLFTLHAQAQH